MAVISPKPLEAGVLFDGFDEIPGTSGQLQIVQSLLIDGEETTGSAVFRGHVGDGGPSSQGHSVQPRPMELDKTSHHPLLPQDLGYPQHQVGGGGAFGEPAHQPNPHHFGCQHEDGLADHGGFRFDTAHSPAQHAQTVDHGGMRVGSHQRIGIKGGSIIPNHFGQVFQVDLVDYSGGGRYHPEVIERRPAPFEELISFPVALEFVPRVDAQRIPGVEGVHLDGMIDHQVAGNLRVDPLGGGRIAGHADDGVPHGGQINDGGHTGEVLQHYPTGREGDFGFRYLGGVVGGQGDHVFFGYHPSVAFT